MKFKIKKCPYEKRDVVFNKDTIEINPGLTILVGCNGSGKTTLMRNIKEIAKEKNIPCQLYNNLSEGGKTSVRKCIQGYGGSLKLGLTLLQSSEGESILLNMGQNALFYKKFIQTGEFDDIDNILEKTFNPDPKPITSHSRILLFDAVDSGLSIDGILELKELFNIMINDAKEIKIDLYIIIAANEYELCSGEQCFDVTNCEYTTFKDYNNYKEFIINSRNYKNKRIDAYNKNIDKSKRRIDIK